MKFTDQLMIQVYHMMMISVEITFPSMYSSVTTMTNDRIIQ